MRIACQLFIMLVLLSGIISCDGSDPTGPHYPEPTAPVLAFVNDQNLPMFRYSERFMVHGVIEAFGVTYGRPMDCEMGCVYSEGYGLRVGTRLGWISFDDAEGFEPDSESYYDVAASDSVLFDTLLWDQMHGDVRLNHYLWSGLLPRLARDIDTPSPVLVDISNRLYTYISWHVAWQLLENPSVQANEEVLSILAELPVFQGDGYGAARTRAQELLEAIDAL